MTETSGRRFCPGCGGARSPAAQFCEFCGARLEPVAEEIASVSPTAAPPTAWRAEVEGCLRRDELDRAERALDAVVAADPACAEAIALQAHLAMRRFQTDDAWDLLERARALAPRSPFVRLQLADYWLRLGVTPKAEEQLREALPLAEGDAALEAHLRASLRAVRGHARAEFGRESPGSFKTVGSSIRRLFMSKRARRRSDATYVAAGVEKTGV